MSERPRRAAGVGKFTDMATQASGRMSPGQADAAASTLSALPRVTAIVVSFGTRDLLRSCLESLSSQVGVEVEILVVDNASTDGSADMTADAFPRARLIRNSRNAGFASANNAALVLATGDCLALVNPDTEVPRDTLRAVTDVFARYPHAGAVGVQLVSPDGQPQPSCHAFPGVLNTLAETLGIHRLLLGLRYGTPTEAPRPRGGEGPVDWVSGAFMVLSRDAYLVVGGLNEQLFLYGEEMDWSWRARQLGYDTVFCAAPRVLHHGGASGPGRRGELFVRNVEARLTFLRCFRGSWRAALVREVLVAGALLRFAWWRAREVIEGRGAGVHVHEQTERFRAVLQWRARLTR